MLTRVVNGKEVQLTPAEEAEVRAQWAAETAKPAPTASITAEQLLAALEKKGAVTREEVMAEPATKAQG